MAPQIYQVSLPDSKPNYLASLIIKLTLDRMFSLYYTDVHNELQAGLRNTSGFVGLAEVVFLPVVARLDRAPDSTDGLAIGIIGFCKERG